LTPSQTRIGDVGEGELLRRLRARIPEVEGALVGVGDDAAVLEIDGPVVVTADGLVEGVHFQREWTPPSLLGRKALSVSLSDVAAMGGTGRYAVVSLSLPPELPVEWVDSLYDGLLERAAEVGVGLVGGNVARSRAAIVIDVTVLGQTVRPLLRSGARPGDLVVVTGTLGTAAEGVTLLQQGARLDEEGALSATGVWTDSSSESVEACLRAQLDPRPPLALARSLAERDLARAGMDLSDGLSSDLAELCRQSGLGARVEARSLPVSPAMASLERARGGEAVLVALHGGEDYELLLAVDPADFGALEELARVWGVTVTAIGEFLEGEPGVRVRDEEGERPLPPAGHDHFRIGEPEGQGE
jgi:thiamine-monophosphate kinase